MSKLPPLFLVAAILYDPVVFSIDNTIRLAMYSNRFLIKTMQMVGPRDGSAKPIDQRAIINGLIVWHRDCGHLGRHHADRKPLSRIQTPARYQGHDHAVLYHHRTGHRHFPNRYAPVGHQIPRMKLDDLY